MSHFKDRLYFVSHTERIPAVLECYIPRLEFEQISGKRIGQNNSWVFLVIGLLDAFNFLRSERGGM